MPMKQTLHGGVSGCSWVGCMAPIALISIFLPRPQGKVKQIVGSTLKDLPDDNRCHLHGMTHMFCMEGSHAWRKVTRGACMGQG